MLGLPWTWVDAAPCSQPLSPEVTTEALGTRLSPPLARAISSDKSYFQN